MIKKALLLLCTAVFTATAIRHYDYDTAQASLPALENDLGEIVMLEMRYDPPLGIYHAQNKRELECLAKNIQEEAGRAIYNDKVAVAYGTINRVKSKRFPNSICAVIYQKNAMSWTKDPVKMKRGVPDSIYKLAKQVLIGKIKDPSPHCAFTNWYNARLDSKKSYNYGKMMRNGSCVYKPKGSPHFYLQDA